MPRRVLSLVLGALLAGAVLAGVVLPAPAAQAVTIEEPPFREITFPVQGAASFHDDFGAPRSSGRTHQGNDVMGAKHQPLLAAVGGTVSWVRLDAGGTAGNGLTIRDADGWSYMYLHLNNDSPGTDDGLNRLDLAFAPGIERGVRVEAGQVVGFLGDSGNAEGTSPHLHFEIHQPDRTAVNPWASLRLSRGLPAGNRCGYVRNPEPEPSAEAAPGYYVLGRDGGIFSFGDAEFQGSVPGLGLGVPVETVLMAATPTGEGYYVLGRDGGIFSFGDAEFHGSVPGLGLTAVRAIDLRLTPSGLGYWVLGADGGIFSFGDAEFHGSVPGLGVQTTVRKLVPTPSGDGYWILGTDGGIFSFGNAEFHGSVPGLGLGAPVTSVAMAATAEGAGYWVLGADGGIFSFGDAEFQGSIPGYGLCRFPAGVQLTASSGGEGYWILGDDGSTWAFGDAVDHGSVSELGLPAFAPTIDLVALPATATATDRRP